VTRKKTGTALLALGLMTAALPAAAGELRVTVRGLPVEQGELRVALYDSASGFRAEKRFRGVILPARKGDVRADFTDLPLGRYGIAVLQDLNGNGKLDTNFIGMPTEPYGFGNDAKVNLAPPAFDEMAVTIGTAPVATTLTLR
jgi:uncharacterized protein (DUF2141 family)